jgi:U6 snRNA-associated Sm-like protein LSm8
MDYLPELKDKKVNVITMDGRCIVGILKGSDSVCNLVLQDTEERIFSTDKGMEVQPLGLYIVRGDSV